MVPKFSYKAQLVAPHSTFFVDEGKWVCNIPKAPYNSFPPALLYDDKSDGNFPLSKSSQLLLLLELLSLLFLIGSTGLTLLLIGLFWDAFPFAVNLHNVSKSFVFSKTWELSSTISSLHSSFLDPGVPSSFNYDILKHLSKAFRIATFPDITFYVLHLKAAKQKNVVS